MYQPVLSFLKFDIKSRTVPSAKTTSTPKIDPCSDP